MASGRKGQSDITLGGGHVAGIFLGVVLLCGIFFTLGYVMARGHTSSLAPGGAGKGASVVDANGNLTRKQQPASSPWDFYPKKSGSPTGAAEPPLPGITRDNSAKPNPQPQPAPPPAPAAEPVAMAPKPAGVKIESRPPALARGRAGISLQVAALKEKSDARVLAGFLKQRGYPAFAWGPGHDHLFRVEVGPYTSLAAAKVVQHKLDKQGFKSILRK